jgi:transposase
MKLHGNAALSWSGRRRLAERVVVEGWTLTAAAQAAGVSVRCARKWVGRYRLEGERGLLDRSSTPRRIANRTSEERIRMIVTTRRLRFTGPEIAELLGMAVSTVSGILTRQGVGGLGRLGLEHPVRYERSRPGELVHIDVKRLGRIEGGAGKPAFGGERRLRPQSDPHRPRGQAPSLRRLRVRARLRRRLQRLAYVEVLPDEQTTTAIGFLERADSFYRRRGIRSSGS